MLEMTAHAAKRAQQRAIGSFVVDLLTRYGKCVRRHDADVWFLTKQSRKAIRRELGNRIYARIEDQLNVYVVTQDGTVITVANRQKRIRI